MQAGYCTWTLKMSLICPISILCPAWGQSRVLEIAGMAASSEADKGKWSFKFLNSSFWRCFAPALLTPCPAISSRPGVYLNNTKMSSPACWLLLLQAAGSWAPTEPMRWNVCAHYPFTENSVKKSQLDPHTHFCSLAQGKDSDETVLFWMHTVSKGCVGLGFASSQTEHHQIASILKP